jgi:hypothetical protein
MALVIEDNSRRAFWGRSAVLLGFSLLQRARGATSFFALFESARTVRLSHAVGTRRVSLVFASVALLTIAIGGERGRAHGMASGAGSIGSFGYAMVCLLVIDGGAGFGEDFGMTGFALIFYTLIVLAMRESHVAVLSLKQDRFRWGESGRELLNNDLIIVGRWVWCRG